jgi:hypothetical protein
MSCCKKRVDDLREAAEARKLSMPLRNLDLIVVAKDEANRVPSMNYGFKHQTARDVWGLLDCFDRAEQMTAYEFDAYDTLGEDECDRQGIETLHDMFGTDFAVAFYRRKEVLIAKHELQDAQQELRRAQKRVEDLQKIIDENS